MAKGMFMTLVATECAAEYEAEFNKWYNEVHVPMLLKYKGLKNAGRYQLMGESEGQAKYLAAYIFESKEAMDGFNKSPELAAALKETEETWKDRMFELKWMSSYQPIQWWEQ